ncbi:MAG: hypothetical protein EOP14_02700 [Pseudomonas sp.]|nr:MAG: hypothetical protein EOP14_02700 [Pseudomonas sp.]
MGKRDSSNQPKMCMQDPKEIKDDTDGTATEGVPIDGRDIEGEELMKSVRNDQLENPPPPVDQ